MALPAFVVAILHAVPLGLPSYLALRRRGWANLGTAIFTGACAGVTPIGLLTLWPVAHASAYSGGAWQAIDGVRTAAGWIEWSKLAGFLAANGAAAGAAFWATIRFWPGNRSGQTIDEVFA